MSADFDPSSPATNAGIYGLPHTSDEAGVILVPVPWEPTTSYRRGTAKGPAAILQSSRQIDLFDADTGRPYEAGICMLEPEPDIVLWNAQACKSAEPVIARGGLVNDSPELAELVQHVNTLSALLNERVESLANTWISRGKLVGIVGGDHAVPFGSIKAHAERFPGLGILHVDAHADLRRAYEGFSDSHASIFYNVLERLPSVAKLVQVALRDFSEDEHNFIQRSQGRVRAYYDGEIAARLFEGEPFARIAEAIVKELPEQVYVSIDIDGLDPSLCPHTGTPVPGGLSFQQAVHLLRALVRSGRRVVGFDLCEVAPNPSEDDEWDGNVGARLLYKTIGFALMSRASA